MAPAGRLCCAALLCGALSLCSLRAAPRQPDTLYLWIDAQQARLLIGFEEDILIVSEGKMAPFTHDFRKAQQRMPAIPVGIHAMNFTWQATGRVYLEVQLDPVSNQQSPGFVKMAMLQIDSTCTQGGKERWLKTAGSRKFVLENEIPVLFLQIGNLAHKLTFYNSVSGMEI
ncbi:hypothetical protein TURU_121408 [Turdus rufiventris]|nr:hypothetical protein TURU_121408 [Turdus rufiventris]